MQDYYSSRFEKFSCVALDRAGCENNDTKCCRQGNPYPNKQETVSMLVHFQNPHTNMLKLTLIWLSQCKIIIHKDLRNVLELIWVGQAVNITMQDVTEKEIHTLDKWEAVSILVHFHDPYTNMWKQTVIRFSKYKITIHRDLGNVFALLCVGLAAKTMMQNVAGKKIHTLDKWESVSMLVCFQNPYTNYRKK